MSQTAQVTTSFFSFFSLLSAHFLGSFGFKIRFCIQSCLVHSSAKETKPNKSGKMSDIPTQSNSDWHFSCKNFSFIYLWLKIIKKCTFFSSKIPLVEGLLNRITFNVCVLWLIQLVDWLNTFCNKIWSFRSLEFSFSDVITFSWLVSPLLKYPLLLSVLAVYGMQIPV